MDVMKTGCAPLDELLLYSDAGFGGSLRDDGGEGDGWSRGA